MQRTVVRSNANVLVIASDKLWERDFLREVIPVDAKNWNWIYLGDPESRWQQVKRIVQCAALLPRVKRGVLVFSSSEIAYREIRFFVRLIRPRVLIQLSDELGTRFNYARLKDEVDVFVRQYHHASYGMPDSVLYMPLGYMAGMLHGRSSTDLESIPQIADREHIWSFAGNAQKQDRQEVLRLFADWNKGVRAENITPAEIFDLYRNSIFVPSPRGNFRLDCLRLYEGSLAGAIPVVAGPLEEIRDTFRMEEDPPWIIADTWERALDICQAELERPELLQERQRTLLAWWKARIDNLRNGIHQALDRDQSSRPGG